MKKILLTLVLMVGVVLGLFAQNLTYQAVIRDNNQQLVTNTAVKATVTIAFATGDPYSEEVNGSTNLHGLLSFKFGGDALNGRDWTGATIAVKVVNAATPSTVYVNDDARPVSAVPYALSVNGQSIQNYLTEHNYVDLAKLEDTLGAYSTTDVLNGLLQQLEDKIAALSHKVDSLAALIPGGDTTEVADGQPCPGTPTVSDGTNTYNTVKIGNQCWMKENLRTTTKRNGAGKIYTENTETGYNAETYGYYYDWEAVMQNESGDDKVRGICPEGWHVPSDAEWTQLTTYVKLQPEYVCEGCSGTDNEFYTNCIANALSSPTGWDSCDDPCTPGNNPSANNATGFSVVPAGYCFDGNFDDFGDYAYFWSATQSGGSGAWSLGLRSGASYVHRRIDYNAYGLSVRCLKD